MARLYGYKFISQFGEDPCDDWVTVLVNVTGRQIADGLNRCLTEFPEWPPGAAQFRALCLGLDKRDVDENGRDLTGQRAYLESEHQKQLAERKARRLALEDPTKRKRTKDAYADHMRQMRGLFGTS